MTCRFCMLESRIRDFGFVFQATGRCIDVRQRTLSLAVQDPSEPAWTLTKSNFIKKLLLAAREACRSDRHSESLAHHSLTEDLTRLLRVTEHVKVPYREDPGVSCWDSRHQSTACQNDREQYSPAIISISHRVDARKRRDQPQEEHIDRWSRVRTCRRCCSNEWWVRLQVCSILT